MTSLTSDTRSIHDVYAEGLRYFMGEGTLQGTLAQVSSDLKRCGIDYMVIGAVALMAYGYPRFTEVIDLVLTKKGWKPFTVSGSGWVTSLRFRVLRKDCARHARE